MESDTAPNSECSNKSVFNASTNSHRDTNQETQHGRALEGREERRLARERSSVSPEAELTDALAVSSEEGRGEEQPERVNSRETVEQAQTDASTTDASPMFKPLPNSVLHKSPAKKPIKEPLFRPSPPSDEERTSTQNNVISLHSTSSEAASDNDHAIVVEGMISSYESLFTPPASSEDDTPLAYFRTSKSKKTPRYVMTHVQVPPLRRPKSDYKDLKDVFPSKPPRKKTVQVQAHSSLLAALQSQMAHNSEIHDDEDMIVEKPPKKKGKPAQRNAVAGPSRLLPPSDPPRSKTRPKRRFIESSSSSDESTAGRSTRAGPVSKAKSVETKRKRQKITIDLTLDEDDEGTPAPSTPRRSSPSRRPTPQPKRQKSPNVNVSLSPVPGPSAKQSSPITSPAPSVSFRRSSFDSPHSSMPEREGLQLLNLRFYHYPHPSILHVNTQFHRQWFHGTAAQNVMSSSVSSSTTGSGERHDNAGVFRSRFPWGGLRGGSSARKYLTLDDDADVISLGYTSLGFEYDDANIDGEDADADIPALKLERRPSFSPVVEKEVRPVRIDLAAELKKRKLAKGKQKQKQNNLASLLPGPNRDQERPVKSAVQATSGKNTPETQLGLPSVGVSDLAASGFNQLPSLSLLPSTQHQQHVDSQSYFTSSIPSVPYPVRRPLGNLGVFMHDYAARSPSPDAHSRIASGSLSNVANASSLASFSTAVGVDAGANPYSNPYSLTLLQGPLAAATNTTAMPHFHQSDEILLTAIGNGAGQHLEVDAMFPSGTVFNGDLAALNESWMTTGQQCLADYGCDTVDPTLICGGFTNSDDGVVHSTGANVQEFGENARLGSRSGTAAGVIGAAGGECTNSEDDREEANVVSLLSDTSMAGSLFSGPSGTLSIRSPSLSACSSSSSSSPTSSVAPVPTSLTSMDGSPSSRSSGFSPSKPSRLETSGSPDISSVSLTGASNTISEPLIVVGEEPLRVLVAQYESSPLSDLTSISDDGSVATPELTETTVTLLKPSKLEVVIVQKPRKPAPGWDEDTPDSDVYCHQCRSRNSHPKTRCACKAKYCGRCVSVRPKYIQMLKPGDRVYSCPRCEQWCTCSACCRKRGEAYVPARAQTTLNSPSPAVAPRVNKAFSARLPPAPPPPSSPPVQVRKAFLSSSRPYASPHIGKESASPAVIARPSSFIDSGPTSLFTSEPLASTPKKKSRVFIGKVHRSWGLGKKPRTRELNPAPRAVWPENPAGPCTVRYYIGSSRFLQHKQLRLESTDDLLAGLTSVASLEDSDTDNADNAASATEEAPLVNDDKSNRPLSAPAALCDRDVARALSATYESLGHTVILSEECR